MEGIDNSLIIKQKVNFLMDMYPGLFHWMGEHLYFIDKRITHQPMILKVYKGFGKGGNVLNIAWKADKNRNNYAILLEEKQSGSLELTSEHHQIPDASCVALFDMGIEIIVRENDYGVQFKYNKKEIRRKHTIESIINHD